MVRAACLEGSVTLQAKVDIPPLMRTTRQKLKLDGRFEVRRGKFLRAAAQGTPSDAGLLVRAYSYPIASAGDRLAALSAG